MTDGLFGRDPSNRQPPFQWREGSGLYSLMVKSPIGALVPACQRDLVLALKAAPLQVREDIVREVALPMIERLVRDADELESALKFRRKTYEDAWQQLTAAKQEIEALERMCEDRRNRAKAAELENDRLRKLLESRQLET